MSEFEDNTKKIGKMEKRIERLQSLLEELIPLVIRNPGPNHKINDQWISAGMTQKYLLSLLKMDLDLGFLELLSLLKQKNKFERL